MSEAKKRAVLRYFELISNDQLGELEEVVEPGLVDHTAAPGQGSGLEGLREFFRMLRSAFPDFTASVEAVIIENNMAAARFVFEGTHEGEFMGVQPSGRRVTMGGIDLFRLQDGRISELWGYEDIFGLMQQIGGLGN